MLQGVQWEKRTCLLQTYDTGGPMERRQPLQHRSDVTFEIIQTTPLPELPLEY